MIRPIIRLPTRTAPQTLLRAGQRHQRRWLGSTPPAHKPRSLRSSLFRWGVAGGALYWYAQSDLRLFDQEANEHGYVGTEIYDVPQEAKLPTLESIAGSRLQRQTATAAASSPPPLAPTHTDVATAPPQTTSRDVAQDASPLASGSTSPSASTPPIAPSTEASQSSPDALEEEAESEGAFNEETGEINWDCPCLGGMAHGPCGEQFRDAFSCFVYSKEEPKGVNCIDKFKTMQDCFREHPDIYGAELTDTEGDLDDETSAALADEMAPEAAAPTSQPPSSRASSEPSPAPASAPYSGALSPSDSTSASTHNLTSSPSANPTDVGSGSTTANTTSKNSGTKIVDIKNPSGARPEESDRQSRAKEATQQVSSEHGDRKSESEQARSEGGGMKPQAASDEGNRDVRW